ncbi:hypothetical protein NQ318_001335 [Aromia moschata]|uniref:Tyr recombinase domain-containing protein n=1 Tax=Aromia moschata TaxID=1265417 RepID=A0AAV8ZHZ6_9CUCU|nr:hypothetical protein NQ318_001335 [Aromia moschata]
MLIFASHITSKDNFRADKASRAKVTETEYSLHPKVYQDITQKLRTPKIDLFASYLNAKCKTFISWHPDPESSGRTSPPVAKPYPGGRSVIREACRRKHIPENAMELMIAALSLSTTKQYNSTFVKWWAFCQGQPDKIYQPTVQDILEVLTQEFQNGSTYSTTNTHRYEEIWDPHPALLMLEKLHPLDSLGLKKLTIKLILLLTLGTAHRVQTLSKIRLGNIRSTEQGVEVKITDIIKTSAPKRMQPKLILPFFKEKPEFCAATTLLHYMDSWIEQN